MRSPVLSSCQSTQSSSSRRVQSLPLLRGVRPSFGDEKLFVRCDFPQRLKPFVHFRLTARLKSRALSTPILQTWSLATTSLFFLLLLSPLLDSFQAFST